jgi:hypothetical protein
MTETNQKCCTWQQTFTVDCHFIITIPLHSGRVRLRILLATNQMNIPNQSALTTQCWRLTHTVTEKQPLPASQWCPTCGSKLYCTDTDILMSVQVLILQPAFSLFLMLSPVTVTVTDTMWIALNCSEIQINGNGHYVFSKLTESEVGQYEGPAAQFKKSYWH